MVIKIKKKILIGSVIVLTATTVGGFLIYRATSFDSIIRRLVPRHATYETVILREGHHEWLGVDYRIVLVELTENSNHTHSDYDSLLIYMRANRWGVWQEKSLFSSHGQLREGHIISFVSYPDFEELESHVVIHHHVIIPTPTCSEFDLENLPDSLDLTLEEHNGVTVVFAENVSDIFVDNSTLMLLRDLFIWCR